MDQLRLCRAGGAPQFKRKQRIVIAAHTDGEAGDPRFDQRGRVVLVQAAEQRQRDPAPDE